MFKQLLFTFLMTLLVQVSIGSDNIVENPSFDGDLYDWEHTKDGVEIQEDGDDKIAVITKDNVLYQIIDIDDNETYTCTIEFTEMNVKQTTGYGYAFSDDEINLPDFEKGASDVMPVCENNNGIWYQPDPSLSGNQTVTFDIVTPDDVEVIYFFIATKGAVAKLSVTSVEIVEVETNDVVFTVQSKQSGHPLEDAEITIDGIPTVYKTGEDGKTQITLIPSDTPYQLSVQRDWYKEYIEDIKVSSGTNSFTVLMDTIQEVKKVETRISKYGDNDTPYPLYGHLWNNEISYSTADINKMARSFDYIVGGGGVPSDPTINEQFRKIDDKFQIIRYSGGWVREKAFANNHKMELTYYLIGRLQNGIDENETSFTISAPSNGGGLIESERDAFDIWIRIEDELMKVTNVSSEKEYPITVSVDRGYDGTTPVAHADNSAVTLTLFGNPPKEDGDGANISYFVTNYGARRHILEELLFDQAKNKGADGIWIDILIGRLSASSLFGDKYTEWDHITESPLTGENEVKYTKEAMDYLYRKFYSRMGYYPVIYGNNVLYDNNLQKSSRAWLMVDEPEFERELDGFCHENSWGHVSSDDSGIDHEGQVDVNSGSIREYGTGDHFLEWSIGNSWVDKCKAITLLAQEGLPNQPMTINAGFKNQWFAGSFNDDTRYRFNRYCYASYLLNVDVTADSLISCRMGISPIRTNSVKNVVIEPYFYYQVGLPVENYNHNNFTNYKHGNHNLYSRTFQNGLVLINPFTQGMAEPVEVAEITGNDSEYFNVEFGDTVKVTSVQLDSLESMILLTQQGIILEKDEIQVQQQTLKVFPNPATNFITISVTNAMEHVQTVRVYGTSGVVIEKDVEFFGNSARINISELSSGIYFLKLSRSDEVVKIIKKKY